MDLIVGFVFLAVFLMSYFILKRPRNLPPGPFSLPLVGSIFFMGKLRQKRPHLVMAESAKSYGNIMRFWAGPQLLVVLQGYDMVHEALVIQADVFSGRPYNVRQLHRIFPEDAGKGRGVLFNDYNTSWRSLRRFTLQALRDFGVGKTSIEDKILSEVDAVTNLLEQSQGTPVDMNMYLQNIISNVIYGIVFGKRYDYGDPEFETVCRLTRAAVGGNTFLSPASFLPAWALRLIKKEEAERLVNQSRSFKEMGEYVNKQIDDHEVTFDNNNIRDFIDLYLRTLQDGSEKFERRDIYRVIIDLFLAGSETTSTSLNWVILYMVEYQDVQKKCQDEITKTVGDRTIQYSDRGKLVYVEATLLEIQRLATIVPMNAVHSTLKDTTLCGYNIPKDTLTFATIYSVSQDPKYFTNPELFKPERFIDESGNLIKNEAMIPFSTGPRQCLGEPLARMELFLVFANLLQRFRFEPEDKAVKHSFDSVMFQITNTPLPFKTRIFRRL